MFLLDIYLLIIGFLCYAALEPVWRKLSIAAKIILSPLALFWFVDVFVRLTLGNIFLEIPTWRTITITGLVNSHVLDADGDSFHNYKRYISRSLCATLNVIHPEHCESYKNITS